MVAGVMLPAPMLIQTYEMNNSLAGMPTNWAMMFGMLLVAIGAALSCYGALTGQFAGRAKTMARRYSAPPWKPDYCSTELTKINDTR